MHIMRSMNHWSGSGRSRFIHDLPTSGNLACGMVHQPIGPITAIMPTSAPGVTTEPTGLRTHRCVRLWRALRFSSDPNRLTCGRVDLGRTLGCRHGRSSQSCGGARCGGGVGGLEGRPRCSRMDLAACGRVTIASKVRRAPQWAQVRTSMPKVRRISSARLLRCLRGARREQRFGAEPGAEAGSGLEADGGAANGSRVAGKTGAEAGSEPWAEAGAEAGSCAGAGPLAAGPPVQGISRRPGASAVTSRRQRALGATTPWYRMSLVRGAEMRGTRRARKVRGAMTSRLT